jgi:choline dehydrogenase
VAEVEEADFVIVGAGAAGCVLANRLSEEPGTRVLLLEAGGSDARLWIKVPAGFTRTLHDPRVNWGYETAPGAAIDGRSIKFPRGRVVGGSSSINGHLYVRGQAADYDLWAQKGCRGWGWDDVLPYFRRAETRIGGDPALRGRDGPLRVEDLRETHPLAELFCRSAERLGLARNPDYNSGDPEGCFYYQQLMRGGRRWSAADAYLRPALRRPGLRLVTEALVEQVLLDGRRATGVRFRRAGRAVEARARRAVILCGGAINSPQLLQLSGIGDPAWLAPLGIAVRHALPGVGRGLMDHTGVRLAFRIRGLRTFNERSHWPALALEVLRYAATRRGLLAVVPSQAGAAFKTRPELATPDVMLYFAPGSFEGGRVGATVLEREPGASCVVMQNRPESRGHVRILSPDPTAAPEIQPNYLADPVDQATVVAGLRFVRRLFATPPLADHVVGETFPGPEARSDADLLAHARATVGTTYHPTSTCRMGVDDLAVLDPGLRVHGLDGLYVIDASVFPTMISGNTYAATNMVAEKGADLLFGRTAGRG